MEVRAVELKRGVRDHWQEEVCGTRFSNAREQRAYFAELENARYKHEGFIHDLARFADHRGQDVLEIGVGAGADFANWVRNGARATGVDLTDAAIATTRSRLQGLGLRDDQYRLQTADAEALDFPDSSFDLVYSYGVLHHSPDTEQCYREAFRVLRPGGWLKTMVYADGSVGGFLLWARYGLLNGHPRMTQRDAMFRYLESPGTKCYREEEFKALLERTGFTEVRTWRKLGTGDLLNMPRSRKYANPLYALVWALYPRPLVRLLGDRFGTALLCWARKPA